MKYYDAVIGLGQYCITSTALRRCKLQRYSMPFDWSAGILEEVCGKGGLEGKVNLICNDFDGFFNIEDFENRGNNKENDTYNLWIVNKKTGLQYKYDFPSSVKFEDKFSEVKEKYFRRVERLRKTLSTSKKVLFVFMARDDGFSNEYLIEKQKKISMKYKNTICDFLYIMHNDSYNMDDYKIYNLNKNVCRIDMNFTHPTDPVYPESWNGNTKLYYKILIKNYASRATLHFIHADIKNYIISIKNNLKKIIVYSYKYMIVLFYKIR